MATLELKYSSGGTAGSNLKLRITYTASNNIFKLTEIEGKRSDGYRSYNANDTSVKVTVSGTEKTVSLGHYIDFGNGTWTKFSAADTSWTITNTSPSVSVKTTGSQDSYNGAVFKGTATMSLSTYTISYDANGGSGAPKSQTKTYGVSLTLSSAKPTRTGYTFTGWALSKEGAKYYDAGGTCGRNQNTTLYAVWEENYLTMNYYSNYATTAFDGALNTVGADKNVLVRTQNFYYDNDYSANGVSNYSGSGGAAFMSRTGYAPTGNWGTSTTGGTLVNENTGFATGQALAQALGKTLATGNASINVYAQWTPNYLTVNYYSNYADYCTVNGTAQTVSATTNVKVLSVNYYYDTAYNDGLNNIQNTSSLYLSRTRYDPTGYWGTSTTGGTLVNENTAFATGQALAQVFGKSLETGNAEVNVYAQWVLLASRITWYDQNGTAHRGLCHFYDSSGNLHYAILTVYGSDGKAHVVV